MEKSNNIWGVIGKIAAILTIVWLIIQIFNYFNEAKEYVIVAKGKYTSFEIPQNYLDLIQEHKTIIALDKAYKKNIDKRSLPIDLLKKYHNSKGKDWGFKSDFNSYMEYRSPIKFIKYSNFWSFTVKNQGSKPIEELLLEVPYSGYYTVKKEIDSVITGTFKDRISLGNLAPGYDIKIKVWIEDSYPVSIYDEEKTRITHKYGWTSIDYPVQAEGVTAWIIRNHYDPIFLFVLFILILFVLVFNAGTVYGPKIMEKQKEKKLQELADLEKFKEENQTKKDQ